MEVGYEQAAEQGGEVMSKADKLRERAGTVERAEAKAIALLAKEFSVEEKVAFFDNLHELGSEYLKLLMDDGMNHHVADAFRPRVLVGLWGKDFYDWVYDLQGGL